MKTLLFLIFTFAWINFTVADDQIGEIYKKYLERGEDALTNEDRRVFTRLLKDLYSDNREVALEAKETLFDAIAQEARIQQDPYLGSKIKEIIDRAQAIKDGIEFVTDNVLPIVEHIPLDFFNPFGGIGNPMESIPLIFDPALGISKPNPAFINAQLEKGSQLMDPDLLFSLGTVAARLALESALEDAKGQPGFGLIATDADTNRLKNFLNTIDLYIIAEISGNPTLKGFVQAEITSQFVIFSRTVQGLKKTPSGVATAFHWESTFHRWLHTYYPEEIRSQFIDQVEKSIPVILKSAEGKGAKYIELLELEVRETNSIVQSTTKYNGKIVPKSGLLLDIVGTGIDVSSRLTNVDLAATGIQALNFYAQRMAEENPDSPMAGYAAKVTEIIDSGTSKGSEAVFSNLMSYTAWLDNQIITLGQGSKEFLSKPGDYAKLLSSAPSNVYDFLKCVPLVDFKIPKFKIFGKK